ncbi:MAG TPA: hypothetical protein VFS23_04555 [Vicinamibacterales bacterium]|nr:hypothetical protein [Vicinamibacterales bacterium]
MSHTLWLLAREAKLGLLVAIMAAFGLVLSFIVNLTLTWVTQPCGSVCRSRVTRRSPERA